MPEAMEITFETLNKFCRQYAQGPVSVVDSTGATRVLKGGERDVWDLAEKADLFLYLGSWYSRAQFTALMEDAMRPANPTQIPIP